MARCVWQGIAVVAALIGWRIFADDFATGALAAATTFLAVSVYANARFGPVATAEQVRREILRDLQRRES